MAEGKKINDIRVLDVSAVVDGTLYPVYDPDNPTSAARSSAQQIASYVKSRVNADAAHASEQESTDQAKLASVGKVQELIGEGCRVLPITSAPMTLNQGVIYLVHDNSSDILIDTQPIPAGSTAHVYHDGSGWVVAYDEAKSVKNVTISPRWRYGQVGVSDSNAIRIHKKSSGHKFASYSTNFLEVDSLQKVTLAGTLPSGSFKVYCFGVDYEYIGVITASEGVAVINHQNCKYITVEYYSSTAKTYGEISVVSLTLLCADAKSVKMPPVRPSTYTDVLSIRHERYFPVKVVAGGYPSGTVSSSSGISYSDDIGLLKGVVRLPANYTASGPKVDFIWFCRGSSAPNSDNFESIYEDYIKYLLKEGYAVVDCSVRANEAYDEGSATYIGQYYCTPSNKATLRAFYEFLTDEYNFNDNFYAIAKSQGGLKLTDILSSGLPVRAACYLAARVTPFDAFFGSSNAERYTNLSDIGIATTFDSDSKLFTGDYTFLNSEALWVWDESRRGFVENNADKFVGLCPLIKMTRLIFADWFDNLQKSSVSQWLAADEAADLRCPIVCFGSETDNVFTGETMYLVHAAKNGNNIVAKQVISGVTGDQHHAVDTLAPTTTVVTAYGGEVSGVPITYAQTVDFFKHF